MLVKLPIVTLIALNGVFILTPAGMALVYISEGHFQLQRTGSEIVGLPDSFYVLRTKEDILACSICS
jgi:hypothetical protein